jgi:peptide-methionine (S)-S-oxide reductase
MKSKSKSTQRLRAFAIGCSMLIALGAIVAATARNPRAGASASDAAEKGKTMTEKKTDGKKPNTPNATTATAQAIFAAGCFWGVEAAFRQVQGVVSTEAGYTGGHFENPTYEDVCSDKTGHAEAVRVVYDPSRATYDDLLRVFWKIHNPTTPNRQGPDVGSQYRSAIFYLNEDQRRAALASKARLEESHVFPKSIVTEIVAASKFYPAEEYHQQYLEKRGLSQCHI